MREEAAAGENCPLQRPGGAALSETGDSRLIEDAAGSDPPTPEHRPLAAVVGRAVGGPKDRAVAGCAGLALDRRFAAVATPA
jgi:hypothetical protein